MKPGGHAGLTGGGAGSQGLEAQSGESSGALGDLKQQRNRSDLCFPGTVLAAVGRLDGWGPEEEPEPSWPVGSPQAGQKQPEPQGAGAGRAGNTGRGSAGEAGARAARMSWRWEAGDGRRKRKKHCLEI